MLVTATFFFHATTTSSFWRRVGAVTNTQILFGASIIGTFDEELNQEEQHDEHKELFYHDQLVNHFNDNNKDTWKNRRI